MSSVLNKYFSFLKSINDSADKIFALNKNDSMKKDLQIEIGKVHSLLATEISPIDNRHEYYAASFNIQGGFSKSQLDKHDSELSKSVGSQSQQEFKSGSQQQSKPYFSIQQTEDGERMVTTRSICGSRSQEQQNTAKLLMKNDCGVIKYIVEKKLDGYELHLDRAIDEQNITSFRYSSERGESITSFLQKYKYEIEIDQKVNNKKASFWGSESLQQKLDQKGEFSDQKQKQMKIEFLKYLKSFACNLQQFRKGGLLHCDIQQSNVKLFKNGLFLVDFENCLVLYQDSAMPDIWQNTISIIKTANKLKGLKNAGNIDQYVILKEEDKGQQSNLINRLSLQLQENYLRRAKSWIQTWINSVSSKLFNATQKQCLKDSSIKRLADLIKCIDRLIGQQSI